MIQRWWRRIWFVIIQKNVCLIVDTFDMEIRNTITLPEGVRNIYMKRDEKLPNTAEFNNIFKNAGNKIRLQQFLKTELHNIIQIHGGIRVVYSLGTSCWDLTSTESKINFWVSVLPHWSGHCDFLHLFSDQEIRSYWCHCYWCRRHRRNCPSCTCVT